MSIVARSWYCNLWRARAEQTASARPALYREAVSDARVSVRGKSTEGLRSGSRICGDRQAAHARCWEDIGAARSVRRKGRPHEKSRKQLAGVPSRCCCKAEVAKQAQRHASLTGRFRIVAHSSHAVLGLPLD